MKAPRDPGALALGLALLVVAVVGALGHGAVTARLAGGGAPVAQRPLAGGTVGENPPVAAPLRVVVIDGLARADAARLPTLAGLCERGLALTVDVGFPTKSLPVQRVLWSGLTAQQAGAPYGNQLAMWPPSAVPPMRAGVAVVESHGDIARSVGFVVTEPGTAGLDAAIGEAVAGDAGLVMIHLLAVDVAAHRHGRRGDGYRGALSVAEARLAGAVAAAPAAQWLVLSDHGHLAGGGHGDVEDEVRRVQACWAPAPPGVEARPGAEVHLVDVARWIADAVAAPRHPRAVGRTLAVAVAHPDRDATLPVVPAWRVALAALVAAAGLALAVARARPRPGALWPLLSAAMVALCHGAPTLSDRPSRWLLVVAGAVPAALAQLSGVRTQRAPARNAVALLVAGASVVLALSIVSGVPGVLLAGPPARTPFWTGVLAAAVPVLGGAVASLGALLAVHGGLGGRPPAERAASPHRAV